MTSRANGHGFRVGKHYRNRKGEYEVLEIRGSTLRIRYTDGHEDRLDAELQDRIIQNMKSGSDVPSPASRHNRLETEGNDRPQPSNSVRQAAQVRGKPSQPIILWDYQQECLQNIREYRAQGKKRALIALPTGTGKTIIFAQLPKLVPSKKVLVLAHRKELIEQAQAKFREADPQLNVQIEQGSSYANRRARVVVASVQTLARAKRLSVLSPGDFGTIIIDECHHAPADTYLRVLSYFGLVPPDLSIKTLSRYRSGKVGLEIERATKQFQPEPEAPFLVGFTATPHRTDRVGLGWIFDDIVYSKTIMEMLEAGWICNIRGLHIETRADITRVGTRAGDFVGRELSQAVNTAIRNGVAVKAYREHCADRCCLVFCVGVEHAKMMTKAFNHTGIDAKLVVGATPPTEREQNIEAFRSGDLKVLVGVGVMTEGFDAPKTSAIIMARPTMSQLLYTQMIGRGTRKADGKGDLLVIDLVDNARMGIANLNTLFGLHPSVRLNGEDVLSAHRQREKGQAAQAEPDSRMAVDYAAREIDILAPRNVNPKIKKLITMPWVETSFGYWLYISDGAQIGVVEDPRDFSAQIQLQELDKRLEVLAEHAVDVTEGLRLAEHWVKFNHREPLNRHGEPCLPGKAHHYELKNVRRKIEGKQTIITRCRCMTCFHTYEHGVRAAAPLVDVQLRPTVWKAITDGLGPRPKRHQYEGATTKGLKYQYTIEGFPQATLGVNGRRSVIFRVTGYEMQVHLSYLSQYFESQRARRRAMRHGKLPPEADTKVKDLIAQAVDQGMTMILGEA